MTAKERQRTLYNVTYREDFRGTIGLEENRTNSDQLPFFHLNVIVEATKNFSLNNKLGEGGFGTVYKVSKVQDNCILVSLVVLN